MPLEFRVPEAASGPVTAVHSDCACGQKACDAQGVYVRRKWAYDAPDKLVLQLLPLTAGTFKLCIPQPKGALNFAILEISAPTCAYTQPPKPTPCGQY